LADVSIRLQNTYRHLNAAYEARGLRACRRLLEPGDVFWDVGANIGLYACYAARIVGSRGHVVAWEPNPATYAVLADHLTANGIEWSTPLRSGVSDVAGQAMLGCSSEVGDPCARFGAENDLRVEVAVDSLDAWAARLPRAPDLVKIDVEGAEVLVLRGARGLLGSFGPRPNLLLAVHPMFLGSLACHTTDLKRLLADVGYETFDTMGVPAEPTGYAEYVAAPRERGSLVRSVLAADDSVLATP
jgi:FkbM family methyltransferase